MQTCNYFAPAGFASSEQSATGAGRSPRYAQAANPSDTLCLTIQSRGTKIVPILLPLSQALGGEFVSGATHQIGKIHRAILQRLTLVVSVQMLLNVVNAFASSAVQE